MNRKVYSVLSADIKTHMPMIGSYFSKIGYELHGNIQWIAEIIRIGLS